MFHARSLRSLEPAEVAEDFLFVSRPFAALTRVRRGRKIFVCLFELICLTLCALCDIYFFSVGSARDIKDPLRSKECHLFKGGSWRCESDWPDAIDRRQLEDESRH